MYALFVVISSGIGELVDMKLGLFDSWHHSLFSSLYNRLKRSTRRSLNPDEASLFIVPYDYSMDRRIMKDCTLRKKHSCPTSLKYISEKIFHSKYFKKHNGIDHVIITSLAGPFTDNCHQLSSMCSKCAFTSYWIMPTEYESNFISLPFPSYYHYSPELEYIPWDLIHSDKRIYKISYVGSMVVMTSDHTKIRRKLITQCLQYENIKVKSNIIQKLCYYMSMTRDNNINKNIPIVINTSSTTSNTTTVITNNVIFENNYNNSIIRDIMDIYSKSIFCLSPPGDDPTRKALIDILVSGCIPVVFHPMTLFNQYPYQMTNEMVKKISIFIPINIFLHDTIIKKNPSSNNNVNINEKVKFNVMKFLNEIPDDVIKDKQYHISKIAPKLQYSVPSLASLQDIYDTTAYDSPMEDAVDTTINGLITRVDRYMNNESVLVPGLQHMSWGDYMSAYNEIIL
jgi:hypothetical protein